MLLHRLRTRGQFFSSAAGTRSPSGALRGPLSRGGDVPVLLSAAFGRLVLDWAIVVAVAGTAAAKTAHDLPLELGDLSLQLLQAVPVLAPDLPVPPVVVVPCLEASIPTPSSRAPIANSKNARLFPCSSTAPVARVAATATVLVAATFTLPPASPQARSNTRRTRTRGRRRRGRSGRLTAQRGSPVGLVEGVVLSTRPPRRSRRRKT